MRQAVALVTTFGLIVGLAGCTGSESVTPQETGGVAPTASAAGFDDTTGALQGTVINEEGLPIPGAQIGLLETQAVTLSAEDGQYSFSNLQPGDYSVQASTLGFEPVVRRVTIEVGVIAQVNFQLTPVAVDAPYYFSDQEIGHIECSITWMPGTPLWVPNPGQPTNTSTGLLAPAWYNSLQACGVTEDVQDNPSYPLPPTKFILQWNVTAGSDELLGEMNWQSTQVTGSGLSFVLEDPEGVNDGTPVYGNASGKAPLSVYANRDKVIEVTGTHEINQEEDDWVVQARAFSTANTTDMALPVPIPQIGIFPPPSTQKLDAGLALDQNFEIWLTYFWDMDKPDRFSALPDA